MSFEFSVVFDFRNSIFDFRNSKYAQNKNRGTAYQRFESKNLAHAAAFLNTFGSIRKICSVVVLTSVGGCNADDGPEED